MLCRAAIVVFGNGNILRDALSHLITVPKVHTGKGISQLRRLLVVIERSMVILWDTVSLRIQCAQLADAIHIVLQCTDSIILSRLLIVLLYSVAILIIESHVKSCTVVSTRIEIRENGKRLFAVLTDPSTMVQHIGVIEQPLFIAAIGCFPIPVNSMFIILFFRKLIIVSEVYHRYAIPALRRITEQGERFFGVLCNALAF